MGMCEMCGTESQLVGALVEGTLLKVCGRCSSFGNVIAVKKPSIVERATRTIAVEEVSQYVAENCPSTVKHAREHKGWKQRDLAQRIGEKESVVHHIESGHLHPPFGVALKLEKVLGVKLIASYQAPKEKTINLQDTSLTIGDLVKLKDKRKH